MRIAVQKINTAAKRRLPFCKKNEFLEVPFRERLVLFCANFFEIFF
jgi:hypothetical protein